MQNKNTVVTFVDFKKVYDSVDRQTLFQILYESGIDENTRRLVEQTLTNTTSRIKFQGEISEPFKIKTGVQQGNGLSPILFNLDLDKIVKTKKNKFSVKCLGFTDDLALISENRTVATVMLDLLHEIAEKTGLYISYEKTEYTENKHNRENIMKTKFGEIKRVVDKFKYLGEWIQASGLDNTTNKETQNYYNKKSISIQAKIRHFNSVIRPQVTYGSESLTLN